MIRYFTLVAILISSLTVTAQVKIANNKLYAKKETHYDILMAIASHYNLKLTIMGPKKIFEIPIHMTAPINDIQDILCSFHYLTGMSYSIKGKTLTVEYTSSKQCICDRKQQLTPLSL